MTARVVPSECPRCRRGSETWTIERARAAREGTAGCPCGEVIAVAFEGEPPPLLSKTPKKPRGWREEVGSDRWGATLRATQGARLVALGLTLFWAIGSALLIRQETKPPPLATATIFALEAVGLVGLVVYLAFQRRRRWAFAIQNGRFRVDAVGTHHDIAIEDILSFEAVELPRGSAETTTAATRFRLSIHRAGATPVAVPLAVDTAAEAQWIAERANEVLASGGRIVDAGYRGERLRVAADEPAPLEEAEEEPPSERRARRS